MEEHRKLLKLAMTLNPADSSIGGALADFFLASGNVIEAKEKAFDILKQDLNKLAADKSRQNQANVAADYDRLGRIIDLSRGGMNPSDLQDADAYYAKAVDNYRTIKDIQHLGESLSHRAGVLRRMRTESALSAAVDLYEEARSLLPAVFPGLPVNVSLDGRYMLTNDGTIDTALVAIGDGKSIATYVGGPNGLEILPLSVDISRSLILVQNGNTVAWVEAQNPQAPPKAIASEKFDEAVAGNGNVLGIISRHDVTLIPKEGSARKVWSEETGQIDYAIASGADVYAVTSPTKLVVRKIEADHDTELRTFALQAIDVGPGATPASPIRGLCLSPDGSKAAAVLFDNGSWKMGIPFTQVASTDCGLTLVFPEVW